MKLQMNESQNIEFKQTWRDEYIKASCAFGNTEGGKLYIGVDDDGEIKGIDNAKKLLEDIPNNPLIAYPFFLAGYIESWGRGIEKIIEESHKFNGITPQFRWENGLWVEFYFNKVGEKVGENLSENQYKIIEQMRLNPKISAKDLSSFVGISSRKIEENIKKLKEQSIIKRIGGAKGGHWEVKS